MKTEKHWYDYLWIAELIYFSLGLFNILFAWVGLCMFFIPLLLALAGWDKAYCNRYCGRGQLFALLGGRLKLSRYRDVPGWLRSRFFRYGFLLFFMVMFCSMLHVTWLVFSGAENLRRVVTRRFSGFSNYPGNGPTAERLHPGSRSSPLAFTVS